MTTPNAVLPYESLLELRAAYNDLARNYAMSLDSHPPDDLLDQANQFLQRGRETGALLDDPDERLEVQNKLNFWATILYRHRPAPNGEPPASALLAFGSPVEHAPAARGAVPFQAPPLPPDLYVGREHFISELKRQLKAGRNIALYSPPGTGKTLIATKLAHDPELREKFCDGVLWARLGEPHEVYNILRGWAKTLGLMLDDEDEDDWGIDRHKHAAKVIRDALVRRRMLLVIDDAWQSDAALSLKLGGPNCAHIVTTYRMSVALDFDPQGAVTVPNLSESDALDLLAQATSMAINGEQAAATELVTVLGNSSLALSLIANYYKQQGEGGVYPKLDEVKRRLLENKELIERKQSSKGTRDEVQTPTSLLAAIAWIFEQLDEDEQYVLQAFASIPPKPNTFSDAAAQFIAGNRSNRIGKLLDYGLLKKTDTGRYFLHRAFSDFLKYRQSKQPDDTSVQRMVTYYVELVKSTACEGGKELQVLEEEEKNILAALATGYDREMWKLVVDGTNALFGYLDQRGLYKVAKENLYRARHAAEQLKGEEESLATTLLLLGWMEERLSEYLKAREHLQASLEKAALLKNDYIQARALQSLGVVAMAQGEYDDAENYLDKALELARKISNTHVECMIQTRLGWIDRGVGNFVRSRTRTKEALDLARANHYPRQIAELELSLGVLDFLEQNYEDAKLHDLEGLRFADEKKDKRLQCALHQALGGVEIELNNFKPAEIELLKALDLSLEIEHRWYNGVIWKELGELRLKQKLPNSAAEAFKNGLAVGREVNSPELTGMSLYGLARVAAAQENLIEARLQGQTSLNIFESIGHYKTDEVAAWLRSITEPPPA